jgi:hypothetical protein
MENINWIELLPVVIPSATTLIFAVLVFFLKLKKDSMEGLGKEVSELVLKIVDSAKDRKFTQQEIRDIITEAQDVIEEAKNLLNSE